MTVSRQTRAAVVQVVRAITVPAARTLLYKHLAVELSPFDNSSHQYLSIVSQATDDELLALANELAVQRSSARADAPTKYVFDERIGDLERWLLHDGWIADSGALVRVTPSAEDVTGIRDKLTEDLVSSGLDGDGSIAKALEEASAAFVAAEPDFNAATTHVRIALETAARRAATQHATDHNLVHGKDSWGAALALLKDSGVLGPDEEGMLARVYTFISPGAHVPKGVTDEEWARLARTFGLSSLYFLLRKYGARS